MSTKGLILRLELQPCKCVIAVDTQQPSTPWNPKQTLSLKVPLWKCSN